MKRTFTFVPCCSLVLLSSITWANSVAPQPSSPQACIGLASNSERLACFDRIFPPAAQLNTSIENQPQSDEPQHAIDAAQPNDFRERMQEIKHNISSHVKDIDRNQLFGKAPDFDPSISLLDQRWELSEQSKLGTWQLRPYQPIYAMPIAWTSDKNETPNSPNPNNAVQTPQNLDSTEMKFQLSLKAKMMQNVFGDNGDLWFGYTQSSRWQILNRDESRPFRETNYEPEMMFIWRTNYNFLGLHGRLLGISFNHQSNGRSDPFSRSWNRAIFNIGFEKDNFTLMLRPWMRFDEKYAEDNNPDIKNYIGRGDLTANYKRNQHNYALMLRHSLKTGEHNRGAAQFDWSFPLKNNFRGHFQLFHGYGESLIDYNHRATHVGLGVSLANWF